jgi:transposase-like protein
MNKKSKCNRNNYSHAFKLEIVEEIDNGLISRRGASIKYEISLSSVNYWWEKYSKLAYQKRMARKYSKDPEYENKRLKERIEELELELELMDMAAEIIEEETGIDFRKKYFPESLKNTKKKKGKA